MKISEIVEKVLDFKGRKRKVKQPAVDQREKLVQYYKYNREFKSTLKIFSDMLAKGEVKASELPKKFKSISKKQGYVVKPEALKLLDQVFKTINDTEIPEIRKQLQAVMRASNLTAKEKKFMQAVQDNIYDLDALPEPEVSDLDYDGKPEYTVFAGKGERGTLTDMGEFDTRPEAELAIKKLKLQGYKNLRILQTDGKADDVTKADQDYRLAQDLASREPEFLVIQVDDDGDETVISSHADQKSAVMRAKEESLMRPGRPRIKVEEV